VALTGAFALTLASGFSLNQHTLFNLVFSTDLVVDDAITVAESTTVKKQQGMTAMEAAKSTMNELFTAVIATSLMLLAVFVPVLFFPGATDAIYKSSQQRSYFHRDLHVQCSCLLPHALCTAVGF